MNVAVRYYSRSGNTKMAAEAIARGAGVEAVSVDSPAAPIKEHVDVLFIGGALYAYGLDKHLKEYLKNLDGTSVEEAVVFSSASLSKHALDILRKTLVNKNVAVARETYFVKGKPSADSLKEAEAFGKKMAKAE